ncbi:ABC transporter permease [Streptomyces sp. NPDC049881]|uniref:ABC transporter permease n=1 Tax=Streptomyces sp. NPDC049881 TaxID=3155778 RepID=UPI00341EE113
MRRAAQGLTTLLVASVLVWGMAELAAGDPARQVLAARGVTEPAPAQVALVRGELGLDRPAAERYGRWLADAVRGDLGVSWRTGRPVAEEIGARLPATLRLAAVALLYAFAAAVPLAVAGAWWAGRWPDAVARGVVFTAAALPGFVVGVVLLEVVVVGWGAGRVVADGSWGGALLPAVPLACSVAAQWARVLRTGFDDALEAPFAEVARARGAGRGRLLLVHGVPHAAAGFLTVLGMTVGGLLAGAAVSEVLFTWPGIGRELVAAIEARDVPVVQGVVLLAVTAYLVTGALAVPAAAAIDPRLRGRGVRAAGDDAW